MVLGKALRVRGCAKWTTAIYRETRYALGALGGASRAGMVAGCRGVGVDACTHIPEGLTKGADSRLPASVRPVLATGARTLPAEEVETVEVAGGERMVVVA
jgi:hypothetical protein